MKMKTQVLFALLVSVAMFSACNDDDKEVTPTEEVDKSENSITTFLTEENDIASDTRGSGPWELGVLFSTSVPGKITQVGSKMPQPGNYRIIIWDYDEETLLRQKTVEQSAPGTLTLEDVPELAVEANKKYIISINTRDAGVSKQYYFAYKAGGDDFMPFTKGSILVHEACYRSTSAPEIPTAVKGVKYELYGFPEFTFIPD